MSADAKPISLTRVNWARVAEIVNAKSEHRYSGAYCREVTTGLRKSAKLEPILCEMGFMTNVPPSLANITPALKPVIPPEAQPYCDHRGFINWKLIKTLICTRLGLAEKDVWDYGLAKILKGEDDDCYSGSLAIMRELKLDQIVNSNALDPRSGSRRVSNSKALSYAKNFDIPLDQVAGTGPGGLILKRDVIAFHRGIKSERINTQVHDARLISQRRILANHLRDLLQTNRSLCGVLAANQDRLAATASELGRTLTAKLAAESKLQTEREINARHDATLRRLATRPRLKRTTTHVNIAGLLFRNRTIKEFAA